LQIAASRKNDALTKRVRHACFDFNAQDTVVPVKETSSLERWLKASNV